MEYRLCGDKLAACSNAIIPNGSQYDFISTRDNVDKANLRGIEATFDWQIMDNLSMAANYTYSDSEQLSGNFKGQAFSQTPKHMANASLSWQATTELEAWTRVNFRGRTNQYLSRSSMANELPSYTFVDLGINYALSKNLSLWLCLCKVWLWAKLIMISSDDRYKSWTRFSSIAGFPSFPALIMSSGSR